VADSKDARVEAHSMLEMFGSFDDSLLRPQNRSVLLRHGMLSEHELMLIIKLQAFMRGHRERRLLPKYRFFKTLGINAPDLY